MSSSCDSGSEVPRSQVQSNRRLFVSAIKLFGVDGVFL